MCLLWKLHSHEEDLIFLLIDSQNAFNEENWMPMLWDVLFEWPSGAKFTFN